MFRCRTTAFGALTALAVFVFVACERTEGPTTGTGDQPGSETPVQITERGKGETGKRLIKVKDLGDVEVWQPDLRVDAETKQQIDEIVRKYISTTKSWPEDVYDVRVRRRETPYY